MPSRHTRARHALILTFFVFAAVCPRPAMATISWGLCPESWVGTPSGVLGQRLQCGTLLAPLDHLFPDGRNIHVGVVRVQAAHANEREGAIFFNKGGPGGHPGRLLRSMAEGWTGMDVNDPDDGDKRRLAERFDLIAVIPRGLDGSEPIRCVSGLPPRHAFLPTDQSDANWAQVVDDAQAVADACMSPVYPNVRYVNTEQHVHDMDAVRRALGDERLNFYGISYGGRVGAWYAATYPAHTGRLLLDSSMDFTHDYRAALRLSQVARQREFDDDVLAPLLREPSRFGLGSSADDVALAVEQLPARARAAWTGWLDSTPRLAAALHVAGWLERLAPADLTAMNRLIRRARFSTEPILDSRIRWEATQLSSVLYTPPPLGASYGLGPEGDSVRIITACNDAPWLRNDTAIRESLRRYASRFIHFNGSEILEELTCTHWGGHSARQPDLSILANAPPFLLIQSEKDTSTPLAGGSFILDAFPNARMLLVRESKQHGIFNFTTSGCIERTAATYLLSGALPESRSRVFACGDANENPAEALPGTPRPPTAPVAVDEPPLQEHDEF
jgi:pimeloyl-ACP methyl ester carboxylesterase